MEKLRYLGGFFLAGWVYNCLNHPLGKVYSLVTDLDKLVPFIRYFIVPYFLWYPFVLGSLIYLCYSFYPMYKKQLWLLYSGVAVCFIIYAVFQTTVARPVIIEADIFNKLVAVLYSWDNPYNAFPSIHVLSSYSLFKTYLEIKEIKPFVGWCGMIASIVIIASTQFLKQHTILDGLAGIAIINLLSGLYENYIVAVRDRQAAVRF